VLAAPHMAAGAAIGKAARRPWLALPVAFASHFLLDAMPHLDAHGLFGVGTGDPTRPEVAMAALDALLGIALVLWAVRGQPLRRLMLWGAFMGILADVVYDIPPWHHWFKAWPATAWLGAFHSAIQGDVPTAQWPLGFGAQLAVTLAALWLVRKGGVKP